MAQPLSPTGRPLRLTATAVALLATGALAACGGNDGGSTTATGAATTPAPPATTPGTSTAPSGAAASRLTITAEESGGLSWSRRTLSARAGEVTITMDNPNGNALAHAVEVEGNGVESKSSTIGPGSTTDVRANLRPGTYTFYCPVDGHRQAGMEGTLTVG